MATIPVPDGPSVAPTIPQADTRQIDRARTTPDNYGAPIAQGLGDVAGAQQDIYLRHKAAADEIAVQEAEVRAASDTHDLLYNPQTGALNRKGKDAANIPGQVFPEFDKRMGAIDQSLGNDSQKRAFAQVQLRQKAQLDAVVQTHVAQQIAAYDEQTTQGVIDAGGNTALLNPTMPAMVAMGVDAQRRAIVAHAERNGIAPELRDAQVRETVGNTYVGVIGRLVDTGQTAQARDYYAAIKPEIDGHHQDLIDKALKVAGYRDESRAIADDILHKTDKDGNPLDELQMLQELDSRKITDGELYNGVRNALVQHVSDYKQAEQAVQYDLTNQASQIIDTKSLADVPPTILSRLDYQHRKAIEDYAKQRAKGAEPTTDTRLLNTAYQFSSAPAQSFTDPVTGEETSFLRMNFADPIYPLAKQDREQLIVKQAAEREKYAGKQEKVNDPTQHIEETLRMVLPSIIGEHYHQPSKMSDTENTQVKNFRDKLSSEVLAAQRGSDKVLGPMDVQAIAWKLAGNVSWETPGRLWGTNTQTARAFELPFKLAYSIDDIPAVMRKNMAAAFKGESEQTIIDAYNARVKLLYGAGKLNAGP